MSVKLFGWCGLGLKCWLVPAVGLLLATFCWGQADSGDMVEFKDGRKVNGTILEIRKDAREFDFTAAGQERSTTYGYDSVLAVTFKGRRFVLAPKDEEPKSSLEKSGSASSERSKAEVLAMIDQAGRTPPDWYEAAPLNHPSTLDLDWPLEQQGPWDESKNVGQYIWGRVNPNVARWHSGIKLVHECMARHQKKPELLRRDMEKAGLMYFELLQDYPRAAFWLRKSNATPNTMAGVALAECYWQLGGRDQALELLRGKSLHLNAIKLLGEMGELDRALALADRFVKSNQLVNEALLNAGDALRNAAEFDKAISYYERVLRTPARNPEYEQRYRARARGAIEAVKLFDKVDVRRVADGVYDDTSTGYNGPVEVRVTIKGSRIEQVEVTGHNEKQFYAALTDTPAKIIKAQSIRDIDGTSGATITSQAIIHATARALSKGSQ